MARLRSASVGSIAFDIVNYAFLTFLTLLFLYPFVYILSISVSDFEQIMLGNVKLFPKGPLQILSYQALLTSRDIPRSFLNSVLYSAMGVVFTLLVSSMTAYVLSVKRLPYLRSLTFYVTLTLFLPGNLISMFLTIKALGMFNTIFAVTLPASFGAWNILIMRSNIQSTVSGELLDAAYIDGASEWRTFFTIVLPLIKPILATIALFTAVARWNDFFGPLIYLNDARKYPLTMILRTILITQNLDQQFYSALKANDQIMALGPGLFRSLQMAAIVVAVWPIVAVYPFVQKYFVKGILIGSLKG